MPATRFEYVGIFLVAMATLMLEILLTRIFSVTLFAHLAFVAVSIAMFGMTLGAVLVYLGSRWFTPARARVNLAMSSALFGLTAVWSIDVHLRSVGRQSPDLITSPLSQLAAAYTLSAVPFVFSGIAIAIVLTQFPRHVSRLYAADLAGAALGCVVLVGVFDLAGGPRAVFPIAALAMLASLGFTVAAAQGAGRSAAVACGLVLLLFGATFLSALDRSVRELAYAKGGGHGKVYFEKWNSYSRVAVAPPSLEAPFGWGMSTTFASKVPINQLRLNIDGAAETVMTSFDGDVRPLEHLKYDVTNIGHYLTHQGRVFIVGAGGGRDILSALVFDQEHVLAAEMNKAIIDAVNGPFGDITGHLDRHPKVRFVNDEARSYLAQSSERFDLIQISLIDTWAATAAGAFVLTENTLYTRDAWSLFLSRLTENGILSVSRWYARPPSEVYKTTALASDTLRHLGVDNPRSHIMIVFLRPEPGRDAGVATLLLKRTPFTEDEITTMEAVAKRLEFRIAISPHPSNDAAFVALTGNRTLDAFVAGFVGEDLSPPTDNRPFFFLLKPGILGSLLSFVSVLTVAFIVLPVFLKAEPKVLIDHMGLTLAFAAIGLGFMLIEIAQMQRLMILLGHPTFALSVVLFGLLLSSGAGSFASGASTATPLTSLAGTRLAALVVTLVILGVVTPSAVHAGQGMATPIRIAVAMLLLMPAGFFMGMAFPIAMRVGAIRRESLTPWFWAINGAASVTASVAAVLISARWGIAAAWWVGVGCYIVAAFTLLASARTVVPSRAASC